MIKRIFWGLSACLIFLSCDNDSQDNIINNDSEVVMTGYKINSQSNFSDANGNYTFQTITIGNIVDNKLFSESKERILNGVSQGVHTEQNYFYSNDLLVMRKVGDDKKEFFYDSNQNLIGINWSQLAQYDGLYHTVGNYRFSYHPNSIVFVERVSLTYDDPASEINKRCIVQFDDNYNIIKAGRDMNLDGVMDSVNQFSYTNGNLTSVQRSNGDVLTFEYSNVVNNFMALNSNSYGKKVFRLLESEWHSMPSNNFGASIKLRNDEVSDAVYEVLSNGYYKKKTKVLNLSNSSDVNTTTTEFFFQ